MENPLQGRCITVTGAGGFLGPAAVDALARKGARVQAVIGPPNEAARFPHGAAYAAQVHICDSTAMRKLVPGAEAVVHLSGPATAVASFLATSNHAVITGDGPAAW